MKKLIGYPTWFYWSLLVLYVGTVLSGCMMIPTMLEFKLDYPLDWRLSGAQRLWSAGLHVLCAWVLMMLFGALWQVHMRAGWRKKRNYRSGIVMAVSKLVLLITGVGLYYLSSLEGQTYSAVLHTLVGLVFAALFVLHALQGARLRSQSRG